MHKLLHGSCLPLHACQAALCQSYIVGNGQAGWPKHPSINGQNIPQWRPTHSGSSNFAPPSMLARDFTRCDMGRMRFTAETTRIPSTAGASPTCHPARTCCHPKIPRPVCGETGAAAPTAASSGTGPSQDQGRPTNPGRPPQGTAAELPPEVQLCWLPLCVAAAPGAAQCAAKGRLARAPAH